MKILVFLFVGILLANCALPSFGRPQEDNERNNADGEQPQGGKDETQNQEPKKEPQNAQGSKERGGQNPVKGQDSNSKEVPPEEVSATMLNYDHCVEECKDDGECLQICPLVKDGKPTLEQIFFRGRFKCAVNTSEDIAFAVGFCPSAKTLATTEANPECDEDSGSIIICFEGQLDADRKGDKFQAGATIKNLPNNPIADICNMLDSEEESVTNREMIEKWKRSTGPKHGFQVSTVKNGRFRLATSFTELPFYFDVGKGQCLMVHLLLENAMLARFTTKDGKPVQPIYYNKEKVMLPLRPYDKLRSATEWEGEEHSLNWFLANGMQLNNNHEMNPLLLSLDMFGGHKEWAFYLMTRTDGIEDCIPKAYYLSNQIKPKEVCSLTFNDESNDGVEMCDKPPNAWKVFPKGSPSEYNGRVNVDSKGTMVNFLNSGDGEMQWLNLTFAVPTESSFKFFNDLSINSANLECWTGKNNKEYDCNESDLLNAYKVGFNNLEEHCQLIVSRDRLFSCVSVRNTLGNLTTGVLNDTNDQEKKTVIIENNSVQQFAIGNNKNMSKLLMLEQCVVKNKPVQEFGQVFDNTQPYVLQLSILPHEKPKCPNALGILFGSEYELLLPLEP